MKSVLRIGSLLVFALTCLSLPAQPPAGFVDVPLSSGWNQALGMTFDANGRMYVWEKAGRVWIVENGVKLPTPLIDIHEEVGAWRDFGLAGFALDPNFLNNGHIYLYYVVDRHHLLNFGTPAYQPTADEYFNATISRVTRYTAIGPNFNTVDYNSRFVLLGETKSTGIPVLHTSHGAATLLFGQDGTLLLSTGDGASFNGTDLGGPAHGSYAGQALIDGIIAPYEDVGAFRSLELNSHNGKVLRIDPVTGNGVPSNPFYDPANPRSPKSRTWALGLRNPFRMVLKPNSGSDFPSQARPGILYVGDVGYGVWEELNIITGPGQNFGWPLWEGIDPINEYMTKNIQNPDGPVHPGCGRRLYFRELVLDSTAAGHPDPCNTGAQINPNDYPIFFHKKPTFDWKHGNSGFARVWRNNTMYEMGDPANPVSGPNFKGNTSVGGLFYDKNDFPVQYRTYYHVDYGDLWVKRFHFDANQQPDSVRQFMNFAGQIVNMATDTSIDGFYYISYPANIRHVYYTGSLNQPPVAHANASATYSPTSSLNVTFNSDASEDPENDIASYLWDFGDGTTSTLANPSHLFSTGASTPTSFTVTLTITDGGGLSSQDQLVISLNNTPPVIVSTSIDGVNTYDVINPTTLNLSAVVTDAEHSSAQLTWAWQTVLYHDNHNHPEAPDPNPVTTLNITPIGCDGPTYWYRVILTVTDAAGLSATYYKDIFPYCIPLTEPDEEFFSLVDPVVVDVLQNDLSEDGLDLNTFQIITPPSHGTVSFSALTGKATYTSDGVQTSDDQFTYRIQDLDGDWSPVVAVTMKWLGTPRISIFSPIEGSTNDNVAIRLDYRLSGDAALAAYVKMYVNSDPPIDILSPTGLYYFYNISTGSKTIRMEMVDGLGAPLSYPSSRDTVTFNVFKIGERLKLRAGVVNASSAGWTTVTLDTTYTNMIVIATPVLLNSAQAPRVARIQNTTSNSFQIRIQNPAGNALPAAPVHYIVVEEGVYTEAVDGIKAEAVRVLSTETASENNWVMEPRSYSNSYSTPVVLGQVMSYNDPRWSAFWSSYNGRSYPATSDEFNAGKHVGEDPQNVRNDETIGYLVMEFGTGIIRGRRFSVGYGDRILRGLINSPNEGYLYGVAGVSRVQAGALSAAGMDTPWGQWPVLWGSTPIVGATLNLTADADDLGDNEREVILDQAAYLLVDSTFVIPSGGSFPVEWLEFSAEPVNSRVLLRWATASESQNDYFSVERSLDGTAFEEIGRIKGQGNSSQVESYQAYDESPFTGRSYYRLRQVDFDGAFSYSNVVEVYFAAEGLTVYPNPLRRGQQLFAEVYLPGMPRAELSLLNMLGQVEWQGSVVPGADDRAVAEIASERLAPGVYVLTLGYGSQVWRQKIVIE